MSRRSRSKSPLRKSDTKKSSKAKSSNDQPDALSKIDRGALHKRQGHTVIDDPKWLDPLHPGDPKVHEPEFKFACDGALPPAECYIILIEEQRDESNFPLVYFFSNAIDAALHFAAAHKRVTDALKKRPVEDFEERKTTEGDLVFECPDVTIKMFLRALHYEPERDVTEAPESTPRPLKQLEKQCGISLTSWPKGEAVYGIHYTSLKSNARSFWITRDADTAAAVFLEKFDELSRELPVVNGKWLLHHWGVSYSPLGVELDVGASRIDRRPGSFGFSSNRVFGKLASRQLA